MPSFTVFVDPEEIVTAVSNAVAKRVPQPKSQPELLFAVVDIEGEKENYNPLTAVPCKKRKSPALAPKAAPISAKKQKPATTIKRKASTAKPKRPVRACTMPGIREDPESPLRALQQLVDARCKDLTVSPLADVTDMFDAVTLADNFNFFQTNASQPNIHDFDMLRQSQRRINAAVPRTPERPKLSSRPFTFHSPSRSPGRAIAGRSPPRHPRLIAVAHKRQAVFALKLLWICSALLPSIHCISSHST
ncbi:hypothetical protein DL96DRAFT_1596255 [Flagelloscypha sp. PMI_526]|nr:hypothetical protein DL96DRAFT_1596255 [Flagelloscypha sp. PMI_526]